MGTPSRKPQPSEIEASYREKLAAAEAALESATLENVRVRHQAAADRWRQLLAIHLEGQADAEDTRLG